MMNHKTGLYKTDALRKVYRMKLRRTSNNYLRGILCCVFLLQAYMLNAQMSTEVVYVKNGIVKSFYEVYDNQLQGGGITYRHIGRTISLNRKTYPFYVNLEDNASIRRFINPKDTMGYKQFYNEDFALDAQKGIYKYDLGLSPFEYTYDSVVSSSGCWYYPKRNRKQIIACYYFSGYVILYHVDIKKKDIDSHYRINKMLEQKTFMILKEAETLDYIPLKVTSSMGLRNTPVYSIFRYLEE